MGTGSEILRETPPPETSPPPWETFPRPKTTEKEIHRRESWPLNCILSAKRYRATTDPPLKHEAGGCDNGIRGCFLGRAWSSIGGRMGPAGGGGLSLEAGPGGVLLTAGGVRPAGSTGAPTPQSRCTGSMAPKTNPGLGCGVNANSNCKKQRLPSRSNTDEQCTFCLPSQASFCQLRGGGAMMCLQTPGAPPSWVGVWVPSSQLSVGNYHFRPWRLKPGSPPQGPGREGVEAGGHPPPGQEVRRQMKTSRSSWVAILAE